MTPFNLIHVIAILLTGLVAGLLYGYDCSVVRGLGGLSDREYLTAFQSINKAIMNPYFFTSFMGSLVLLPVAAWMSYKGAPPLAFYFLLAAAFIYIAGVVGITAFGNIPLNNLLEKFNIAGASETALREMRQQFENSWNRLHHIRTYAAIVAFGLAIISLLKRI